MDYFSFFLSFSFLWTKAWLESWPPQVIIESDDLTYMDIFIFNSSEKNTVRSL